MPGWQARTPGGRQSRDHRPCRVASRRTVTVGDDDDDELRGSSSSGAGFPIRPGQIDGGDVDGSACPPVVPRPGAVMVMSHVQVTHFGQDLIEMLT